jgi:hypothetical protein
MSVLVIVLIVVGALIVLGFVGGLLAARRRARAQEASFPRGVAEADQALEEARAADRGWDRGLLEEAARAGLAEARPGWTYEELHLVLVDDRPGVAEDRAHFVATGPQGEGRVVVARRDEMGWVAEHVE